MRLLHTETLEFETFFDLPPPYAILSHTWEADEVLYEDARHGGEELRRCKKAGLSKVLMAVQIAREQKLDYIWIDTCCIDKSSSAELSNAINAMFKWYACAVVCYSYLSDYVNSNGQNREKLERSRWFSRGWTLQELIAPIEVEFYDATWTPCGSRDGLSEEISRITGIDRPLLQRRQVGIECISGKVIVSEWMVLRLLRRYGISTRMSWAARRSTTRPEDVAYCLLGIFDVNMPLLYGEGGVRAFQRLQLEIVRHSSDDSLLAWEGPVDSDSQRAAFPGLASSPMLFRDGHLFRPVRGEGRSVAVSSRGFGLDVYLTPCVRVFQRSNFLGFQPPGEVRDELWLAVLGCTRGNDHFISPALILRKTSASSNSFQRSKWKPNAFSEYECLVVVSMGSGSYKGRMDDMEFTITFDPSTFKKTRILLHEANNADRGLQLAQASVTYRYKTRTTLLVDSSPPIGVIAPPLALQPRSIMAGYGTANLFEDSEQEAFVVGWGVKLPAEDGRFEFQDPDGWRSKQAQPFCMLWQIRPRQEEKEPSLDFEEPDSGFDEFHVLYRKLEWRVIHGTWTALSPRDSLTFTDRNGDRLWMVAEVKIEEFLGRARFGISVSVQMDCPA